MAFPHGLTHLGGNPGDAADLCYGKERRSCALHIQHVGTYVAHVRLECDLDQGLAMPWVDNTAEQEKWEQIQQPFELIREMPSSQTSRVKTITNATQDATLQQRGDKSFIL